MSWAEANQRPSPPALGAIALVVEDWYESVDFYSQVLGLEVVESDEIRRRAVLRAGAVLLQVLSGGWGSEAPKNPQQNPVTLCFQVRGLDRLVYEMEARGACFLSEPLPSAASLMDPEGNRLYLYEGDSTDTLLDERRMPEE